MSFSSFSEFLYMGGHALYVWLAYAAALLVIVGNVLAPIVRRRHFVREERRRLLHKASTDVGVLSRGNVSRGNASGGNAAAPRVS